MFQPKHAYSAITVSIENLTSRDFDEEDISGIPNLVELIKLQRATGPTETSRALRKKLKYGNVHMQLRALVILDALIENAGDNFQRSFANEPLLERLRVCGSSDLSDPAVKTKCQSLFRAWGARYAQAPGLGAIARLYKDLPRRKQVVQRDNSAAVAQTDNPFGDDEEEEAAARAAAARRARAAGSSQSPAARPPAPVDTAQFAHEKKPSAGGSGSASSSSFFGSSSRHKKEKSKSKSGKRGFDLDAEKDNMALAITDSSNVSGNLMKLLAETDRGAERISDNQQAVEYFEACKLLRRRILRYIHNVGSEQWLNSLLNENDKLVHALMSFEQMDTSIDMDSDSDDDELAEQAHLIRVANEQAAQKEAERIEQQRQRRLQQQRQRQQQEAAARAAEMEARAAEKEDEEHDPFADSNEVQTPAAELTQPKW